MDVTLVLTHDCNLGCGYCYAGAKFNRAMPESVARKAVEFAFSDEPKEVHLSFFGGEPLLSYDRLTASALHARELADARGVAIRMSVTTNGTLLTPARARELHELGVYVALSIDGTKEAHDVGRPTMGGGSSFADVERALKTLVKRGLPFETISVVTPANVRLLADSVAYLYREGVPRVGLNPCYEAVWTEEDLAAYGASLERVGDVVLEQFRSDRVVSLSVFDNKIIAAIKGGLADSDKCTLGATSVAVAPSGNLYGCERDVAEDEDQTLVVGHIDSYVSTHAAHCERGPLNPECGSCGERWRCASHCACANRAETGRSDLAGGTQCWHERAVARVADRIAETLWNEQNEPFLAWFYGRGLAQIQDPNAVVGRGAAANEIARTPRAPVVGRKRLTVVST